MPSVYHTNVHATEERLFHTGGRLQALTPLAPPRAEGSLPLPAVTHSQPSPHKQDIQCHNLARGEPVAEGLDKQTPEKT